jgi:hypothetical protein
VTRAEREVHVLVNLADLDDGHFLVESTEARVIARLKRLVGDRLGIEEFRDRRGRVTSTVCKVPAEFFRWSTLGVGRKRPASGAAGRGNPGALRNARLAQKDSGQPASPARDRVPLTTAHPRGVSMPADAVDGGAA